MERRYQANNLKSQSLLDLQALLDCSVENPEIPGVSAALVQGDSLLWCGVAGFADIDRAIELTVDHVQNIGSISKLITATAVMQQVQSGKLNLDQDVNDYLGFTVRNPQFPDVSITTRQLLIHRSSLTDGSAYGQTYACGDPVMGLGEWVREYLEKGGRFYNANENFLDWMPGSKNPPDSPRTYCNVAYGLLGHLVERISGQDFQTYCRTDIFDVLGMKETRWEIGDASQHTVPYTYIEEGMLNEEGVNIEDYVVAESVQSVDVIEGALIPHCLYSFYNYPDGLLRTNPTELSYFLRAYIGGGQLGGKRILAEQTVKEMLAPQHENQGLCWAIDNSSGDDRVFLHDGGDPGISTLMAFSEKYEMGVIVFFNCSNPGDRMDKIVNGISAIMSKLEEVHLD